MIDIGNNLVTAIVVVAIVVGATLPPFLHRRNESIDDLTREVRQLRNQLKRTSGDKVLADLEALRNRPTASLNGSHPAGRDGE